MTDSPRDDQLIQVVAALTVEDGWPPSDSERLWAEWVEQGSVARLDNIPIYLDGYAMDDLVRVDSKDGTHILRELAESGGHSTVRALISDSADERAVAI